MPHMLLIIEPKGQRDTRTEAEGRAAYDVMLRFAADLRERGLLLGANALQGESKGARVQVRQGQTRLLDGPFSEAKEMIGGYFLIDCDDRQQALAIAAQCPAAQWATVEVRAVGTCYE